MGPHTNIEVKDITWNLKTPLAGMFALQAQR